MFGPMVERRCCNRIGNTKRKICGLKRDSGRSEKHQISQKSEIPGIDNHFEDMNRMGKAIKDNFIKSAP